MVGTHNHHPLFHHFPIESLTSFLSFFLSPFCFFTALLIVDFYCIFPTPEGATGPPSPTLLVKEKEIEKERKRREGLSLSISVSQLMNASPPWLLDDMKER